MESIIEPTNGRGVVLGLLKEMRHLTNKVPGLLTKGGDRAAPKAPLPARKTTNTTVVASHRRSPRLTSHDATGSSPIARNNATPISTNIDDTEARTRTTPYVTAPPAEAV